MASGEEDGDERRVRPVEQPRRHAVVLRGDEQLPVIGWRGGEVRARVANEVAEDVLLELPLGVRWIARSQPVEAREEWLPRVESAAVHARVAPPPGSRVGRGRRHLVQQVAEARNADLADRHAQ